MRARPLAPQGCTVAGAQAAPLERAAIWLAEQSSRAVSGMRPSRPLVGMLPNVAPRPVLLVAAGAVPLESAVARRYQRAGGDSVQMWEAPGAGHTGGLRKHPAEYERRTVGFLDEALDWTGGSPDGGLLRRRGVGSGTRV